MHRFATFSWQQGLALALAVPLFSASAWAWNGAGHRLVACIAWEQLTPPVRAEVSSLLRKHPDYSRWDRRRRDDHSSRAAFIESSTWADDIRRDTRFFTAGIEAPTVVLAGFPDMDRHPGWHYVNLPHSHPPAGLDSTEWEMASGQLHRQLPSLMHTLRAGDAAESAQAYALTWLIHLVGDAHQPLHTQNGNRRQGADTNAHEQLISNPFNTRKSLSSLHAFWDDLPGPPWLRGERLERACFALMRSYPQRPPRSNSDAWIRESWLIAVESGYPQDSAEVPVVDEAFFRHSRTTAERRVAEAGHRLAEVLTAILSGRAEDSP